MEAPISVDRSPDNTRRIDSGFCNIRGGMLMRKAGFLSVLLVGTLSASTGLAQTPHALPILGTCLSQPSLSPINLACNLVELDETAIRPLSVIRMPVPGAPPGTLIKQVSGPPVADLSYKNGVIEFVSPADTGMIETLGFSINLNLLKRFVVSLATRQRPLINTLGDGSDDAGARAPSESRLAFSVSGLVYGNVLPVNGVGALSLKATSLVGFGQTAPTITLINEKAITNVSSLFELDALKRTISLKSTAFAAFAALLDHDNALEIVGSDTTNTAYAYEVRFFRGSNTLNLTVTDQNGAAYAPTSTRVRFALRGNDTGMTAMISPSPAGGVVSIPSLPEDSYEITVVDVDRKTIGSALFSISGDHVTGTLKLVVIVIKPASGTSAAKSSPAQKPVSEYHQPEQGAYLESRVVPLLPPALKSSEVTASPDSEYGRITVSSSGQNITRSATQTFQVPNAASPLTVAVIVRSSEYPVYTSNPGNRFNDQWSFFWTCGNGADSRSGRVNISHNTTASVSFDKVVSLPDADGSSPCTISGSATDIGDGVVPTTVEIRLLEKDPSVLELEKLSLQSGPFMGKSGSYYLGLPVGIEGKRRPVKIRFDYSPTTAVPTALKLKLNYRGNQYDLPQIRTFESLGAGTGLVSFTLPTLPLTPGANERVTLDGFLEAKIDGEPALSDQRRMTLRTGGDEQLVPLFETRHVVGIQQNRFSTRDDPEGGDGWSQTAMLAWIRAGGSTLKYNDISGEHAWQVNGKSMGAHSEHKDGMDIDARYKDENGAYVTTMQGDNGGNYILAALNAAQGEVASKAVSKPETIKVVHWIKQNRTYLNTLAANPMARGIYTGASTWHMNALHHGKFPDGTAIPDIDTPPVPPAALSPVLGAWLGKSPKIRPLPPHDDHFHVSLD